MHLFFNLNRSCCCVEATGKTITNTGKFFLFLFVYSLKKWLFNTTRTTSCELHLPLLLPFKQGAMLILLNSRSVCFKKHTTPEDKQFLSSHSPSKEPIKHYFLYFRQNLVSRPHRSKLLEQSTFFFFFFDNLVLKVMYHIFIG